MKKQCNKCKEIKNTYKFHKQKTGKFGVRSTCIKCRTMDNEYVNCKECTKEIKDKFALAKFCSKKCKDQNWKRNNPDLYYEINRKWKDDNTEYILKRSKQKYKDNPHKYIEKTSRRRAAKLNATPSWLTKENLKQIQNIYSKCPKGYHVDHIIPLRGDNVCGLHVPWNLQHLPAHVNLKKGNRIDHLMKLIV